MNLSALKILETRLGDAKGADLEIDAALWSLWDDRPLEDPTGHGVKIHKRDPVDTIAFDTAPAYTASLDAAVALVERVLPNIAWRVTKKLDGKCYALLQRLDEDVEGGFDIWAESKDFPTAPLAMCAALLTALIAQGEQ